MSPGVIVVEGKWWLDNVVKMHVWRGVCLAQCLAFRAAAAAGRPSSATPAPPRPGHSRGGAGGRVVRGGRGCVLGEGAPTTLPSAELHVLLRTGM